MSFYGERQNCMTQKLTVICVMPLPCNIADHHEKPSVLPFFCQRLSLSLASQKLEPAPGITMRPQASVLLPQLDTTPGQISSEPKELRSVAS